MDHTTHHQADAYDAAEPLKQADYDGAPWRENVQDFEAPFLAWLESAEDSAELARKLIRGETPLTDEQARVSIARLAFFAGRQDGVAFASSGEMRWAQKGTAGAAP